VRVNKEQLAVDTFLSSQNCIRFNKITSFQLEVCHRVWSDVPQGSVLGPILFLIFINDLDEQLSARVLKFADDTKLFDIVDNQTQAQNLQKDIDTLDLWAQECGEM